MKLLFVFPNLLGRLIPYAIANMPDETAPLAVASMCRGL